MFCVLLARLKLSMSGLTTMLECSNIYYFVNVRTCEHVLYSMSGGNKEKGGLNETSSTASKLSPNFCVCVSYWQKLLAVSHVRLVKVLRNTKRGQDQVLARIRS